MKAKKRKRGAPVGNQNAAGKRGRKEYLNIFGQRWPVPIGKKILSYLERSGLTQKDFLEKVIADYILSHEHETTNG